MDKKIKELTKVQQFGLLSQLLLTFFLLVLLFVSIGLPEIMEAINKLLIILFLVMGFNNYILYKRKGFTIFNIVAAIILLISMLIS